MLFCEQTPYQNSSYKSVHPVFRGRTHVHLIGDDEQELRLYAQSIGLSIRWLQRDRWGVAHFDVTGRYLKTVLNDKKVRKLERREFVTAYIALQTHHIALQEKA